VALAAFAFVVLGSQLGWAESVAVKVVDAGGDIMFVEPGEAAGLRLGTRVSIGKDTFVVVELNAKTAAIRPETGQTANAAIGAAGTAEVTPRPAAREPEAFREQWPAVVAPIVGNRPTASNGPRADVVSRITIVASAFGAIGDESRASGEARVIATFDGLGGRPLGLDLDVAGRGYSVGWNRQENEPVFVRAAQLRYGNAFAIGRLRYAATSIGMLDGARVAAHTGDLELAAFGGFVPDPLSGEPETSTRFGTEIVWNAERAGWQSRIALAATGSTFDGKLDERRLSLAASAGHGRLWLDGWAEAQQFAKDNPFGAPSVQLTGAGASVTWRSPKAHAGFGVTYFRPEQSLRLAAVLPPEWLCARDASEACVGGDQWIAATASGGLRGPAWSVDAVVSGGRTDGISIGTQSDPLAVGGGGDGSAYLRGEIRASDWRFFVAPAAGKTAFASWAAVELGAGVTTSRVDASLAYRPERLEDGPADHVTLHSIVGELRTQVSPRVDLALVALATFGHDRDLLAGLATVVWRAR
jgi:hypothetical protein